MKAIALVPVFSIASVDASVRYYTEVLRFKLSFRSGTFAGLAIGACELHVTNPRELRHIVGSGSAYLLYDEVDEYYAEVKAAGGKLKCEPENRKYGFRDFAAFDLDGNQISFGSDREPA